MSFATWNFARIFLEWREKYFQARPQARLMPWLTNAPKYVWQGMEGLVGLGEEGEEIIEKTKIKGIVLVGIVLLALTGRE